MDRRAADVDAAVCDAAFNAAVPHVGDGAGRRGQGERAEHIAVRFTDDAEADGQQLSGLIKIRIRVRKRHAELSFGLYGAEQTGVESFCHRAVEILQRVGIEADIERCAADAGIGVAGESHLDRAAHCAVDIGK